MSFMASCVIPAQRQFAVGVPDGILRLVVDDGPVKYVALILILHVRLPRALREGLRGQTPANLPLEAEPVTHSLAGGSWPAVA